MASIMDGCYIPANVSTTGTIPVALCVAQDRIGQVPWRFWVRSDATLKGIRSLTTLRSNLYGHAMLLGLPRYTLGRASVLAPKRVDAPVNYGNYAVNTVIIAKRLYALTTVSIRAVLTTGKVR